MRTREQRAALDFARNRRAHRQMRERLEEQLAALEECEEELYDRREAVYAPAFASCRDAEEWLALRRRIESLAGWGELVEVGIPYPLDGSDPWPAMSDENGVIVGERR